jgi:DnaJ domain
MFEFLKRLFGLPAGPKSSLPSKPGRPVARKKEQESVPQPSESAARPARSGRAVTDEYFRLSGVIESGKSSGDFAVAIRAARETFPLMPAVVAQMKKEFGAFDISTSHAVHTGGTLMAVMGDYEGLAALRKTLSSNVDLGKWLESADQAESDIKLVEGIIAAVENNPGIKQSDLKKFVHGDGRRISTLVSWMDKGGRVRRVSKPPSYALFMSGTSDGEAEAAATAEAFNLKRESQIALARKRPSRSAVKAMKIDVSRLPYVRLPKAPMSWEEQTTKNELIKRALPEPSEEKERSKLARFAVTGIGWRILREESLNPKDRPNPAYKQMFPTNGSTIWLDPRGRREDYPDALSVAMATSRNGDKIAESGLPFDVYRSDVNGNGSGILFMSSDGILHAYGDELDTLFIEHVQTFPEYVAQAQRFGISETQLKNHTRCVAFSSDRTRYLITIVDEAWCYEVSSGKPIWGLRFPTKEGWNEVVSERSERTGVSEEISAALQLMELKLPVSAEEITHQYRSLAKLWHPDKNQQRPEFTRKFQELGAAVELLTGMDLSSLSRSEIESSTYQQLLHKVTVSVGGGQSVTITMSLQVGGSFGADWIYASNFTHEGHKTFLAGYSGRIVEVDARGKPIRIYDIGNVPKQIAETPTNLYILTATRLYVLQGDKLQAFLDVFDQGRLVVAHKGFGLLQSKSLRWFTPDGLELGAIQTKDPIRRAFYGGEGLVVETRSHRAVIDGAPAW